ncbi:MAG: hypothetical protein M1828_000317 [Chrysothrix sp. TS-e1954]|nr:MAG: hypothetical protein M1828_000317 [Chrysothrix sp. TS-e1954]
MNKIRTIEQLNKQEIEAGTPPSASWHRDYDSAYIYAGGLPYNLSEGDVLTIFSQYGEPVWVKLGRDRDTGKSKGFAFLKYEDQRSTDLAVDNLSGAEVLGRKINVDHKVFKDGEVPEEDDEEGMRLMAELYAQDEEDPSKNGDGREGESGRPVLKEEMELQELMQMDDDDPMKASMVQRKQEEVTRAVKKWTKQSRKHKSSSRHHGHRHHHRSRTERLTQKIYADVINIIL